MTGQYGSLAILVVFLLAILGFRSYITADKNIVNYGDAVPDAIEEAPESATDDPIRAKVLELREKRKKADEEARKRGEEPTMVPENAGETDTNYREPTEVPVVEAEEMIKQEEKEDAAANTFLPQLEEFLPLEPMPVLAWRARVVEEVLKTKLAFTVDEDEDEGELVVADADADGLTVKDAEGAKRTIAWSDLADEDLYELAKCETASGRRDVPAGEWLHLSQLAGMVGEKEDERAYRAKALELDASLAEAAAAGPQIALDFRVLNEYSWAWDDLMDPANANNLIDDTPSIIHTYRYMRTVGMDELREGALHNPQYSKVLKNAPKYRGKAVRLEARYVKRFKSIRLTRVKQHRDAGIRDLDFCFVVDAHVRGIYLVSAPQDMRQFADSDIVTLTGVYVRRWPFIRHGRWKWVPWIAALKVEKFEIAPIKGWRTATYLLVTGAAIVFVVIFYFARRDSKEGLEAREKLTRLRSGRDHIRRKVAEAMAARKAAGGKGEGAGDGGAGSDAADGGSASPGESNDQGGASPGAGKD